jgi:hypothetical protein
MVPLSRREFQNDKIPSMRPAALLLAALGLAPPVLAADAPYGDAF